MRFLFTTLQHIESDFYGRVGAELRRRGHVVGHVTYSRRAAQVLGRAGFEAVCLPDGMAALGTEVEAERHAQRIAADYDVPTFRDIYRTDFVCNHRPEAECVERTVRHVLALEQIFERFRPDVLVPEVGNETIRTAAALVARRRDIPVFFLFHTIFPRPLRIAVNSMRAPLAPADEIRPLTPSELEEVERFVAAFKRRSAPIREYRTVPLTARRLRILGRHLAVQALYDRDNDYLRPIRWVMRDARELVRRRAARRYYDSLPGDRPYVYFPLHLADDTKLKRVIPHCADQLGIVEQVARALPHGVDLVVKEHPLSIGRNPLSMLRRLRRMRTVRLLPPRTSSHDIIRAAEAVVVISSTVGLEALLYEKPVLTLGRPFYAGYGVTMDIDSFGDIREAVPAVLSMAPDPERIRQVLHAGMREGYPGTPVLVDRSQENALQVARSLEEAAGKLERRPQEDPVASRAPLRAVPLRDDRRRARS